MEKAFGSIEWKFIEKCFFILRSGSIKSWNISPLHPLISILINGTSKGKISPTRGIVQRVRIFSLDLRNIWVGISFFVQRRRS